VAVARREAERSLGERAADPLAMRDAPRRLLDHARVAERKIEAAALLRELVDLLDALLHGLAVPVDLDEEETLHVVRNVEPHRLVYDVNGEPVKNFTGRKWDPGFEDRFGGFPGTLRITRVR